MENIKILVKSKRTWVIIIMGVITTLNQLGIIPVSTVELFTAFSGLVLGTKVIDMEPETV